MTATFPSSVRQFTAKVDIQDTILADHVNSLQDEVRAVETTIGTTPLTSVYTGTFSQASTWSNLSARLQNIEVGLVNGTGVSGAYASLAGGSVITGSGQSVGLTLQPALANLSNLLTTKSSGGVTGFNVDYTGNPKVGTYNVLYVNSTEYNNLTTATSAAAAAAAVAQTTANSIPNIHPFLLGGL